MPDILNKSLRFAAGSWILAVLLSACAPPASSSGSATPAPQIPTQPPGFVFPPTYTPTEPLPPTVTNTPGPSGTPRPTETLQPTLAPSSTPLVNILQASDSAYPSPSFRLAYFEDGRALVWDPATGESAAVDPEGLPPGIELVSLTPGGNIIAAAYRAAGGVRVVVYSRFTGSVLHSFALDGPGLFDLAIAPGGDRLAVIVAVAVPPPEANPTPFGTGTPSETGTPSGTPGETGTPTATPTAGPSPAPDDRQEILLVDLAASAQITPLGFCGEPCSGIVWSPTGDFLLWGGPDGLWEYVPGTGSEPELLLEPVLSGVFENSQTTESFLPLSVSPSGRFVLVRAGILAGSSRWVVDRTDGSRESLPGSGTYTGEGTGVTWLAGDRIFIARPGLPALDLSPAGEVWRVAPEEAGSFFILEAELGLPGDEYAWPGAPVQLPDGRIGLTLVNLRDGNDAAVNGLYILDPGTGLFERINYLPLLLVDEVVWLPDLTGALVLTESRLLYVPAGFGPIYSMVRLLGTDACCFRWIP